MTEPTSRRVFELPIHTQRLTLRALTMDDLDAHARMFSDPAVVRYLYPETLDRDGAAEHLALRTRATLPGEGEWMNLAVERDGVFLGEVGVSLVSAEHRQCEVGYVFLPEAGGHGYATEATTAMVDLAFDLLGAHRVAGRLDARNDASAHVLERMGMRDEGVWREAEYVKGEWTDVAHFAVTEAEWRPTCV